MGVLPKGVLIDLRARDNLFAYTLRVRSSPCTQSELALHPCEPFLINNRNITGNSFESYYFVVLNVKVQAKRRFKTFY